MTDNPLEFIFDVFWQLVSLYQYLHDFLFYELWDGAQVWQILGGVGVVGLIVWGVVS